MPQLTDAQLAERLTFIGGSDAAAVCGVNPYTTAFDVFQRYMGVTPPKPANDAMRWGTMVEGVIGEFYAERSGRRLLLGTWTYRHPIHTFMGCHPDAFHADGLLPTQLDVVEIKHTSRKLKQGMFPYDYVVQLYHNMIVCQVEQGTLVVAAGGRPPIWQDFTITREITNWIVTIERKFWDAVQQKKWEVFDAAGITATPTGA